MARGFLAAPSPKPPQLFRNDGRLDVHAGAQHILAFRVWVQQNLDRNPLHHFHVIARGILGRQEAQTRASRPSNGINMAGESLVIHVNVDLCLLAGMNIGKLSLLKVGCDPNLFQGDQGEEPLAGLDDLTHFDRFPCNHTVGGSNDGGVTQLQFCRFQIRLGRRHGCLR